MTVMSCVYCGSHDSGNSAHLAAARMVLSGFQIEVIDLMSSVSESRRLWRIFELSGRCTALSDTRRRLSIVAFDSRFLFSC
jgi:hypothetical protein